MTVLTFAALGLALFPVLGLGFVWGLRRSLGELRGLSAANRALHDQLERMRRVGRLSEPTDGDAAAPGPAPALDQEFRTPLNAIIGFADVALLNEAADPLSRRQRQAMDQIAAAGRRLLALVETRLDPVTASGPPAVETVDLRLAARQVCDLLRPQAEARGVALPPPLGPQTIAVLADRKRTRQVLTAMIARVVDDARPGGEVRVQLRRMRDFVEVGVCALPPVHLVSLGPSIAPPPGMRGDLSTARRLTLAMNGRIETVDMADTGPELILMLPPAGAVPASPPPRRRKLAPVGPRNPSLLYVEDHPANIALMRRVIESLGGFDLFIGETGPQGLTMAQDIKPDVILLDINLPELDGLEVKARLALDPVTRDIPVIALSANASADDLRRGREAGFMDYLTKPLDIPTLAAALNRAMGDDIARLHRQCPGRPRNAAA